MADLCRWWLWLGLSVSMYEFSLFHDGRAKLTEVGPIIYSTVTKNSNVFLINIHCPPYATKWSGKFWRITLCIIYSCELLKFMVVFSRDSYEVMGNQLLASPIDHYGKMEFHNCYIGTKTSPCQQVETIYDGIWTNHEKWIQNWSV